jgi:F-type H+-transporting ATPase subunit delta
MLDKITIARPYAQALFRLAQESQSVNEWFARLHTLVTISQDPEMAEVIGNPKFSAGQVADLLLSLTGETDNKELASLLALLARNQRLGFLPEIREVFGRQKRMEEGVRRIVITTAFPLDEVQLKDLLSQLESRFACKLQPCLEVDAELIGGVKVSFTDQVFDASVRGKLDAMAVALKN